MRLLFWAPLVLLFSTIGNAVAGEIALTFDDAPLPGSEAMEGSDRTRRIIDALREAKVPEALFFVTATHITEESKPRLEKYAAAGHYLANHSYEHLSANKVPVNEFLVDAYKAHLLLKPFDNVLPLFRFPYLHHGETPESRQEIARGLKELGYGVGYVTVDNFDWYIDSLYREAVKSGKKINHQNLGKLYVELLWDSIEFYDGIATKTLGRSPKHVLLLHENDLAAIYIADLVQHIRSKGWAIISPVEAYQDPIAKTEKDLAFTKQGRVAALAHDAGISQDKLRHKSENTNYIDKLFDQYKVIEQ